LLKFYSNHSIHIFRLWSGSDLFEISWLIYWGLKDWKGEKIYSGYTKCLLLDNIIIYFSNCEQDVFKNCISNSSDPVAFVTDRSKAELLYFLSKCLFHVSFVSFLSFLSKCIGIHASCNMSAYKGDNAGDSTGSNAY